MARKPETQRWEKAGVELEGAWDTDLREVAAEATGATVNHDGSVQNMAGLCGEIATRPHAILDNLLKDIEKLYPNRVNTTCGLHMHMSFGIVDYSTLTDRAFWDYYQERWTKWGKANEHRFGKLATYFWARLEGRWKSERPDGRGERKNFCKAEFDPVLQLSDSNAAHRYTQVNFSAYHKFQTVESRVLPMFEDKAVALDAITETSNIFNDFLLEYKFPKIVIYKEWKSIDDKIIDETYVPTPDMSPMIYEKETPFRPIEDADGYAIDGAMDVVLPFAREVEGNHP